MSKVGKVPVLDIDGRRIQDSTRIVRYLDERHPDRPLFPAEPRQRALAELWEDWSDELLYWFEVYFRVNDAQALRKAIALGTEGRPAYERIALGLTLKQGLRMQLWFKGLGRMAREDVEAEFLRHLGRIESALGDTGWLVGPDMTIADIAVGSQLLEVRRTSGRMRPELQRRPRLSDWLARIDTP